MKQFLRHIFLLVALFMATANAWAADCTYTKTLDGTSHTSKDFNHTICSTTSEAPNVAISITYTIYLKKTTLGMDLTYTLYAIDRDGQQHEIASNLKVTNGGTNTVAQSFNLNKDITSYKIDQTSSKFGGNRDITISNVTVTYKYAPSLTTSDTTPSVEDTPVGSSSSVSFSVNYQNSTNSVILTANESSDVNNSFSISPTSKSITDCSGSIEYTITFSPQSEQTDAEATYVISGNGASLTVTVTATSFATVKPEYTCHIANSYMVDDSSLNLNDLWTSTSPAQKNYNIVSWTPSGSNNINAVQPAITNNFLSLGQAGTLVLSLSQIETTGYYADSDTKTITINKYDVEASISLSTAVWNEIIDNPFSLSYGLTDFDVEAENTNIAEYHKDTKKIQTYFTDGTAYFQITRPEDYKYKELDKTFSIEVKASSQECNVFEALDEYSFTCSLVGEDRYYTPSAWTESANQLFFEAKTNNNDRVGNVEIHEYVNGVWNMIGEINPDEGYDQYGPYDLSNNATQIRFFNTYGSRTRYFKNVKVTRKTSLAPQVEDDKLYLSQSSTDMTYIGIFNLNWSTCADEIRLSCDNPIFVVTPSVIKASGEGSTQILVTANAQNEANLTGNLTVYDQTQKETIILSCEQLLQRIEWNQYFGNLESTEEGYINETFELNAVAKTVTGNPTNRPITYNLNSISPAGNASLSTENGKTYLHITGKCEGTITASVEGFTEDGKTYSSDAITHDIRVRKAGEPCNTVYYLKDRIELNTIETSEPIYVGDKNPDKLRFIAHRDITAANYFYVVYSTNGGSAWTDLANPMLPAETDAQYEYTLPDNTTHVRFETRTGATWKKYVKNIEVTQKSYLNVDPISISEIIYVNTPFSKEITVQYSDIPLIQSELTKNTTDNLYLYPHQSVNNNCGQYGEYTFTLLGEWEEPQTIQETIRFFTSAGDEKLINIKIDVITNTQITSQADGDWNNPSSWSPNIIPTASHPVIIKHAIEVSSPAEAYGVVMTQGAHINIASTGGLTVHAGGYTPLNENEEDLEITINNDHAGYFRMSPLAETEMPKAIVHFTTRGQLNDGGNDAAYQYIGAPGDSAAMDILGTTVLYLRSEEKGWVRLKTFWAELEPFAGYALTQKEQPTFILYPKLLNGENTIQLTYTEDGMKGDNLWANSYMAPLDITKFTPDDFTGNVIKTFYLYNSGSYDQWKDDTASVSTAEVMPGRYYAVPVLAARALGAEAQTVIPPMQGVYMKANPGGGTVTLNYEKHVWNNTQIAQMNKPLRIAGRNESAEEQIPDFQRVRLQVTSENSGADRMYIIQDSMATSGYDNGYDAEKLMAEGFMNIYTNEPFGKMEISSTNNMNEMYIGFQAGDDSQYTMTFSSLIGDSLYLYDMEADEYIEMTENGQYQFSATPMSTNDLRFQLLVAPDLPDNAPGQGGDVATTIENLSTTKLWISDKMVYVTNVQPNSTLAIYGLGGICVAQYQVPEGMKNIQYPISNLPVGIYIIRLNDQACKFVCK